MLRLKRRYHFAAAHRLHSACLSDDENATLYGPCNHLNGHGHNYEMEVCLSGQPHPETQMLMDLTDLDALVEQHVLSHVDHRFLDKDVSFLACTITTAENLARAFSQILRPVLPSGVKLHSVQIQETANNTARFSPA
jgi:6-pyruvoyltetrahydropterin/6-carboxytetrahydropterin synthase